jgi:predicted acetylornithine/succinylornithine family transaminase
VNLQELQELDARYVMPTYARGPAAFVRGEGARLWDTEGREYLDFFAGLSVHNAGHSHPAIVAAVREQAGELMGASNLFYNEPAMLLAQRLAESSLGGRVFLANSGAEANECAIKLVRKHAHGRGIAAPEVVVLEDAFHGRTLGTLAATPRLAREDLFGPLPAGFRAVPRDDPEALRAAVGPETAAVLLEPIQGESGVHPVPDEVLLAAREACDAAGALLVFDEIQTGMGRTGSLWAWEQGPVRPDVMTAAKALGGGLPVGACVTSPDLGEVLARGEHGSTFAGGALTARAALAALEVLSDPALLRRTRELGARLCDGLEGLDGIAEVRGRGLMVGVRLEDGLDAAAATSAALERGLVINAPAPATLRLLPPLIVSEDDIDEALRRLRLVLGALRGEARPD